jgi:hypothetical protein
MKTEDEYEMAVHVAAAFSHVREAIAWGGNTRELKDAELALRATWGRISANNRHLVNLHAYSRAAEILRP